MTSTGQASTKRRITHSSRSHLCILYFNTRSLYPKVDELCVLCDLEKPDIVCITETWFCEDVYSTENVTFQVISVDMIYMVVGWPCIFLKFQVTLHGSRNLLVSVYNVNRFQYVGLWYRPPVNSEAVVLYSVWKVLM